MCMIVIGAKPDKKLQCNDSCNLNVKKQDIKKSSLMHRVAHLEAGLQWHTGQRYTLFADAWVRMFFMRPVAMKAPLCRLALNNCIVQRLLINMRSGWGTIPAVLSGANRGTQGDRELNRGPIIGSPGCLAMIQTAELILSDVGCVSVYLSVSVCLGSQLEWRELCLCVYPMIENLSSTALNHWLVWPCQHSPFVLPATSDKEHPSCCILLLKPFMM